jgi:hypothetical protein
LLLYVILGEAEVDHAGGVGRRVVEVVGAAPDPGAVERVVVPGVRDGGAGGQGRERAARGAVGRGRGGGGGGPGPRGGPVALEVELEAVEERAGDEGAEHEAAPALHQPLQRHDDAHPAVRAQPRRRRGLAGPPIGGGGVAVVPHGEAARWWCRAFVGGGSIGGPWVWFGGFSRSRRDDGCKKKKKCR